MPYNLYTHVFIIIVYLTMSDKQKNNGRKIIDQKN
jgi:hypothetical protein